MWPSVKERILRVRNNDYGMDQYTTKRSLTKIYNVIGFSFAEEEGKK